MTNLFEKRIARLSPMLLVAAFFIWLLLHAWVTGGRWDLNEQIAFGERLTNGFSGYATGINDLFFPSSPYLPAVGLLSYFYDAVDINSLYVNNMLMIFTAVATGFIYFLLLLKLTLRLYPHISKSVACIVLIALFATHFKIYMSYMSEFKPDTALLVIATLSFLILEKGKKPGIASLIYVGLLLFVATFFKQSFFICYLFVVLLVLSSKFFSVKEKASLVLAYGVAGAVALWIIFSIPGVYYFCVDVMSQHPRWGTAIIINYVQTAIRANIVFLIVLTYFVIKRFRSFSFFTQEGKYGVFALVWFAFSAISTAKLGGNSGNVEVGIIVFAPFAIYMVDAVAKRLYSRWLFVACASVLLLLGAGYYTSLILSDAKKLKAKIEADEAAIAFLSNHFANKTAFVDGDTYIVSEMAGMHVLTEIETVGHFNNVPGYNFSQLKSAIEQTKYDVFFLKNVSPEAFSYFEDKGVWEEISSHYMLYENADMPKSLSGKIFVPKQAR